MQVRNNFLHPELVIDITEGDLRPSGTLPDQIDFQKDFLNLIFAPSGFGKSRFLKMYVRNLIQLGINDVYFLDQFPDIYSRSFNNNIFGPSAVDKFSELEAELLEFPSYHFILDVYGKKNFRKEFSGGELKKIGIARSIISKRSVLILDEPLSGLDHRSREQTTRLLCQQIACNRQIIAVEHQEIPGEVNRIYLNADS